MLTARDIERKDFSRVRNAGYSIEEVDAFLDEAAATFIAIAEEKEKLASRVLSLSEKLEQIRDEQEIWKKSLINTQKSYDEVIEAANAKAAQIVRIAEEEAAMIKTRALKDAEEMSEKIDALRLKKNALSDEIDSFKASLLSLYEKHITLIRDIPLLQKEEIVKAPETKAAQPVEEIEIPTVEEIVEEIQIPTMEEIMADDSPTIVIPTIKEEPVADTITFEKLEDEDEDEEEAAPQIDTSSVPVEMDDDFDMITQKKASPLFEDEDFEDEEETQKDRESILKDLFSGGFSSKKKSIFASKDAETKKRSRFFVDDDEDDDFDDDDFDDDDDE